MPRLTANVAVENPETGTFQVFEADEEPPAWATKLITNPEVWDEPPASSGPTPPPKSGAKGSTEAWDAYAKARGVEVPEGASRSDIIAACEAAGVPTE